VGPRLRLLSRTAREGATEEAMTRYSLMILVCLGGAACDKSEPAANKEAPATAATASGETKPTAAEPKKEEPKKALKEQVVGTWLYESLELPGTPEGVKKQILAEMKKSSVEFTADKFTSYQNGKVFSSEAYEVVEEKDKQLTIKLTKAKKTEVYTFEDDNTMTTSDKELGKIVMKRKL
jgi:hypothetical protein